MSEYQLYEFRAIDGRLDQEALKAVRALSSRAKITPTRFFNEYHWGDFRGDPRKMVEQWYDLHLYYASWGGRRLMLRLPKRLVGLAAIEPFIGDEDVLSAWECGDNLIVDLCIDEVGGWEDDPDEDWLDAIAPLRDEVLNGDLRMFYLVWLLGMQWEVVEDDETEPLPGIGPASAALRALGSFLGVDDDLMDAAEGRALERKDISTQELRARMSELSTGEKEDLLTRLVSGERLLGAELRARFRPPVGDGAAARTAGELRRLVQENVALREKAHAERRAAEERRAAAAALAAQRARMEALKRRGEDVWLEIEAEIGRRNGPGYGRAVGLLTDVRALALEADREEIFERRLEEIGRRHATKRRFMEQLTEAFPDTDFAPSFF